MMLNVDFMLRLLVAGILGAIIGLDREYRAKEAGYRTHFLVSLGSALIMIVSQYGFQEIIKENSVTLDPSRVAAQVVSGIGFIGAGTIILQKRPWTDHSRRHMGYSRHRSGSRRGNVHHRHSYYRTDSDRPGITQLHLQECRHEKFDDLLLY